MYEDVACAIAIIIGIIIFAVCIVIPIVYCSMHNKDKEIELEKYKIEMQIKNGDIPTNEVGELKCMNV